MYFVKTPFWLKKWYSNYCWSISEKNKTLYLTFDDGPHPVATPFALAALSEHNAKATFFCVGKNVVEHPDIFQQLIADGHAIGNHTHNHLNGWKTKDDSYFENIATAARHIPSTLFRPPYGRISRKQAAQLLKKDFLNGPFTIVMWDVLSGDFDTTLSPEKCLSNVVHHSVSGSIIVFHDSAKAFPNMRYALPETLAYFATKGFTFKPL